MKQGAEQGKGKKTKEPKTNKKAGLIKEQRQSSIGVKMLVLLLVMVIIATAANLVNYNAMKRMNAAVATITGVNVTGMRQTDDIQAGLQSLQKDFYRFLATKKGEEGHTEAQADYDANKKALNTLFTQYISTGTDTDKTARTEFYTQVSNILQQMDSVMELYDAGQTGKASIAVNKTRESMAAINETIAGLQTQSQKNMDQATAGAESLYESITGVSILMTFLTVLAGLIGVIYVLLGVVKPMRRATKELRGMIRDIEGGKGDLTAHLHSRSHDEIGQMIGSFNQFIDVLEKLIEKIKKVSSDLEASAAAVNDGVRAAGDKITDTSATMQELSASMQEASETIQNITGSIDEMKQEITRMAEKTGEGLESVNDIQVKADEMKESAARSQASVDSMISEISA